MKKIRMLATLVLCALLLTACGGDVSNVQRDGMDLSRMYSEDEIGDAMDVVEDHFRREFEGCRLKNLRYTESVEILAEQAGWAAQYGEEEAIVFLSDFSVSRFGGDGSFDPNHNYINWKWVLTRSDGGKWTLRTWGYG